MQTYYITNHPRVTATLMQAREPSELRVASATFPQLESTVVSCYVVDVATIFSRSRLQEIAIVYFFGVVK